MLNTPLVFRHPVATDGVAVFNLIARCPPLDQNSRYCNLLQCTHFSHTCIAAFKGERTAPTDQADSKVNTSDPQKLVGFISGYRLPDQQDTLFLWQMAVAEEMRGQGLASRLIKQLLGSQNCQQVSFIETTVTAENRSSWLVFEKLASELSAPIDSQPHFKKHVHFDGRHDTESLIRIGPFSFQPS